MNNFIRQLLLIFILLLSSLAFSQVITDKDLELEDAAFSNLESKNYKEAAELFSQLMSLYPKNYSYNLYYAECLIEQNKDIDKALKFLNKAKKGTKEPEINYYLGRAYHLSYDFDKAVEYFQKFKDEVGEKVANKNYSVDREIRMANNGKELIKYISDLTVIENKHIKRSNYYYSYQLNDYGGKLIVKSPDFMTKKDKKSKEKQLMFMSDSGYVYFSSYGKRGTTGLDIYRAFKNADGSWSESEKLSSVINTVYDDAYPYLHSDGKTLYFSSKGHNSMGGYDIFKSVFDSAANKWGEPENMDFPTNTPYDDYLYISDKNEDYAYFTSNRETTGDKISVYKILVDKNPIRKEYDDIDMIKIKSKLKISSPEEVKKTKERNEQQRNLLSSNNRNITEEQFDYNFEKLKLDDVSSVDDVVNENEKDVKKIEKEIEKTKSNVNKALVYSYNKNKQADEIRQRANNILSQSDLSESEKKKAKEFNKQADVLEQEAVLAYNMATVLDANVKQKTKDAENAKKLSASLKNTQDLNKSVESLNVNREKLSKGKEKYFDTKKEIEKKSADIEVKKRALAISNEKITKIKNEVENNNETIKKLKAEGSNKAKIKELDERNAALNIQYQELSSQKEIIEADINKKQTELTALKNIETEFNKTTSVDETTLAKINKDELAKVVETKSFELEAKQKQELAEKQTEASNKLLPTENIELAQNTQTNNATKKNDNAIDITENTNQTTETKLTVADIEESDNNAVNDNEASNTETTNVTEPKVLTAEEVKATNTEVAKLRAEARNNTQIVDSLNTLIAQKEQKKANAKTPDEKHAIAKEIESLAFVVDIKQKQIARQNKEADALESVYLADNKVGNKTESVAEVKAANSIIAANTELESLKKSYHKNKLLADSLYSLSEEKQKLADNEKDEAKMNEYIDEAEELSQLAEIKQNQSYADAEKIKIKKEELTKLAIESEKDLATNEKLPFETNISENSSDEEKYKNELLKKSYYQNQNKDLTEKLNAYQASLQSTNVPEAKKDIERNIEKINNQIKQNSALAIIAETKANNYKKQVAPSTTVDETSQEELYADATSYKLKNTEVLNENSKEIESISKLRKSNNAAKTKWEAVNAEVNQIEKKISETKDPKEKKALIKRLESKKSDSDKLFAEYEKETQKANFVEHNLYTDLIDKHQTNGNTEEEVKANNLVKQADLYYEEATNIRNNEEKTKLTSKEKLQALSLEQISINKQKQALDLYLNVKPEVAQISTNNKPLVLVLTSDDKSDLKNSRKISYKVEKQKKASDDDLAKLMVEKRQANKIYTKDKAKILENINKKEIEISNKLIATYNTSSVADSLKYNVYKKQLGEISTNNNVEKQNKLVANEYIKGADYFYSEAQNIRAEAQNEPDVVKKRKQLEKAYNLEKMALQNQEIAVNTLLNKNEDEFVSTGSFVKVDPLEKYDSKVDTKEVESVTFDKVVEQITLTDAELKQLNELAKVEKVINDEKANYDKIEGDITFLKADLEEAENSKQKQKIQKNLDKKEAELLASTFAILDFKEKYNDTKFYVLYDNLKANRKKGKSKEIMQARQLEKDASKDYKRAKQLREKSYMVESAEKALAYNQEAAELEDKSISNITKAYSLYLNIDESEIEQQLAQNTPDETDNLRIVKNTTADISPATVDNKNNNTEAETNEETKTVLADNEVKAELNTDSLNTETFVAETTKDENTDVSNNKELAVVTGVNNSAETNNEQANTSTNISENETNQTQQAVNVTENNSSDSKETTLVVDNKTSGEVENISNSNTITIDSNADNVIKLSSTANYAVYPISQYTEANPIPVNPKLPNGIVFKVQVGAFKRPIRQNSFNGLSPIAAEKIAGSAYTRYLAGMFMSYEGVRTALTEIKTMGYKDAFIVAYRDGKRIPLYIARGEAKKNIANYSDVAAIESENVKSRNKNAIDLAQNTTVNNNSTAQNEGPLVVAKDIKKTAKLLYTVQIGVYKKAVPHSRLYNLSPIYEEQTPYGFIRYTTGIFSDITKANAEKNRIRKIGIKDAFVTAYYEGKKISLQKAQSLKASNVATENNENISLPQVKVENKTSNIDATNLYYKVQIGAYKEQIPVNQVASWLSVARKQDLKQFKDERGYTVFAVGNYKSYDEAAKMKAILINEGVKDAFVVAYSGNKKVSVTKAKEVLGK